MRPDCRRRRSRTSWTWFISSHTGSWSGFRGVHCRSDPGDDAILEAAIAGGCDFVVSFNERHLRAAREFGIEVLKPADLLKLIGESK